jgi:hypothetical protein
VYLQIRTEYGNLEADLPASEGVHSMWDLAEEKRAIRRINEANDATASTSTDTVVVLYRWYIYQ